MQINVKRLSWSGCLERVLSSKIRSGGNGDLNRGFSVPNPAYLVSSRVLPVPPVPCCTQTREPSCPLVVPLDPTDRTPQVVLRARDRADSAFDAFMTERAGGSFDQKTVALLLSAVSHMSLSGDLLNLIAGPMGYRAVGCTDGALAVREQEHVLLAEYRRLADSLTAATPRQARSTITLAALRDAALLCLRRWQTDPEIGRSAMAVVMAAEWVQYLARLQGDLDQATSTAREAALKPWWR
jgi:hypothetical protein